MYYTVTTKYRKLREKKVIYSLITNSGNCHRNTINKDDFPKLDTVLKDRKILREIKKTVGLAKMFVRFIR